MTGLDKRLEPLLPHVWRAVRAYERNSAAQEDLMQEVLMAIWQGLPRLRDPNALLPFALRIAHNLGASHVRRALRDPLRFGTDTAHPEPDVPGPGDGGSADTAWLVDAMRKLPLPQRQVLLLQLEGFDYKEIADMLGITVDNVGVRAHRAKRRLQELHDETH